MFPDVSLFAAAGLAGSFYLICQGDQTPIACDPNNPTSDFLPIGGTSASSPAFAGIMALVNQQTGSRQGNANYVLYKTRGAAAHGLPRCDRRQPLPCRAKPAPPTAPLRRPATPTAFSAVITPGPATTWLPAWAR